MADPPALWKVVLGTAPGYDPASFSFNTVGGERMLYRVLTGPILTLAAAGILSAQYVSAQAVTAQEFPSRDKSCALGTR